MQYETKTHKRHKVWRTECCCRWQGWYHQLSMRVPIQTMTAALYTFSILTRKINCWNCRQWESLTFEDWAVVSEWRLVVDLDQVVVIAAFPDASSDVCHITMSPPVVRSLYYWVNAIRIPVSKQRIFITISAELLMSTYLILSWVSINGVTKWRRDQLKDEFASWNVNITPILMSINSAAGCSGV